MDVVQEIGKSVGMPTKDLTSLHVSMHKDNSDALVLAQTLPPQFAPRGKYYTNKTVWLWEEVMKQGIHLLMIDTQEQLGDIFTFEYLGKIIMGW